MIQFKKKKKKKSHNQHTPTQESFLDARRNLPVIDINGKAAQLALALGDKRREPAI